MYETLTTMAEIAEEVGNILKVEKGVQSTFGLKGALMKDNFPNLYTLISYIYLM